MLGEEPFGRVGDEAAARVGIEARRPRTAGGGRRGTGQAEAPAPVSATEVTVSPGASGWWQAT